MDFKISSRGTSSNNPWFPDVMELWFFLLMTKIWSINQLVVNYGKPFRCTHCEPVIYSDTYGLDPLPPDQFSSICYKAKSDN